MNYSLSRAQCCRTIRQGGGACIYAKTSLMTIERKEVAELSVEMHIIIIEACAIECVGLDVIVVCIYRRPKGDTELFFEKLDALLNLNAIKNYKIIVAGDLKIYLLTKSSNRTELKNTLKTYGFRSLLNCPTRTTSTTKSCLDHFYSNIPKSEISEVKTIDTHISDHNGIFLRVNTAVVKSKNRVTKKRLFSENNTKSFYNSLDMYDWNGLLAKSTSPNKTFEGILNVFKHYFDVHFPLKKCSVRNVVNTWVSEKIRNIRNRLHNIKRDLAQNHGDAMLTSRLHDVEQLYISQLIQSRREFVNKSIAASTGNMSRSVWRVIASETCRSDGKQGALDVLIRRSPGDCV